MLIFNSPVEKDDIERKNRSLRAGGKQAKCGVPKTSERVFQIGWSGQ